MSRAITEEWLETFDLSLRGGEDLSKSPFWRLAVTHLPYGVNRGHPGVVDAIRHIQACIAKAEASPSRSSTKPQD